MAAVAEVEGDVVAAGIGERIARTPREGFTLGHVVAHGGHHCVGDRQHLGTVAQEAVDAIRIAVRRASLRVDPDPVDRDAPGDARTAVDGRSEGHTSELQSLMRTSYAVFCLKKKTQAHIAL